MLEIIRFTGEFADRFRNRVAPRNTSPVRAGGTRSVMSSSQPSGIAWKRRFAASMASPIAARRAPGAAGVVGSGAPVGEGGFPPGGAPPARAFGLGRSAPGPRAIGGGGGGAS